MRSVLLSFVLIVFVTTTAVVATPIPPGAKQSPTEAELKRFKGRWKMESTTLDGKKFPSEVEVEFKGELMISRVPQEQRVLYTRIVLDLTAKPRRITANEIEEPKPGQESKQKADRPASLCLYTLDGDTLTIAGKSMARDKFPESMESKPGSDTTVMVLKRTKD